MFSIEYIFHSVIDEAVASSFQISVFHVFISIHFVNVKASALAAPSCAFTFTGAHHTPGATAWSLKRNQSKGHRSVSYPNQMFLLAIGISIIYFEIAILNM